ncbi:TPA: hypothetical protein ACGO80_001268 [Streptococcus suis]
MYHEGLKYHLYTTSGNEKNVLIKSGWKDEGIIFHAGGSQNVYRLYHAGLKVHLYTTDINEYNTLPKNGWNKEGIAWSVE